MSNRPSRPPNRKTDRTAAVTLEVPSGAADEIEAVLRGYAEEAELDTSLVVDHSGFLIAGISSIPDVDVDTIGALVAGASGATEGLTGALGEAGQVESLHLGEDRLLYLKEIGERFILVGVSDSNIPAGILRDQARMIEPRLVKLLEKVKAVPMSLTRKKSEPRNEPAEEKPEPPKSLRQNIPTLEPVTSQSERPKARPISATVAASKPAAAEKISGTVGIQPSVGAVIPGPSPVTPVQKDPIPEEVFAVEEATKPEASPEPVEKPEPAPEAKRSEPRAVVEGSPFEMDDGDEEEDSSFKPARPNTTPVHLAVPAARQREAAARKQKQEDDDSQSGPRYSFELG